LKAAVFVYKTREKYYIIIMIYKTTKEYRQALEQFARLRKDYSTSVLELDELYQKLIDTEKDRQLDRVINLWLDNECCDELFYAAFYDENDKFTEICTSHVEVYIAKIENSLQD
jgi:hypothetical protein